MIENIFARVIKPSLIMIFLASMVMLQNKKRIVKLLERADMVFTILATKVWSPKAKRLKNLPNIWNNGAPGGWPTSSLYAVAMYSPQSQKLMVGSDVKI
jgi:hypothetical protein